MACSNTRTQTYTACVYGPCFVCVMRITFVRGHVVHVSSCACSWSCFMCLNMNDQEHELELEHQVNCVLTPPSPFSFRARMRASMDATMSCFTNSAVAAYVCACVFVVSRLQASAPDYCQTLRGLSEHPDRSALCGRDTCSTSEQPSQSTTRAELQVCGWSPRLCDLSSEQCRAQGDPFDFFEDAFAG